MSLAITKELEYHCLITEILSNFAAIYNYVFGLKILKQEFFLDFYSDHSYVKE